MVEIQMFVATRQATHQKAELKLKPSREQSLFGILKEKEIIDMEEFRNELMMELIYTGMDAKSVDKVGIAIDKMAKRYEINRLEQHLAVIEDGIPELVKIYAACKISENCSKDTVELRVLLLKNLFAYTQTTPYTITPNDIRLFLYQYAEERGTASTTMEKYRQMIKWFFDWCTSEKYIIENPAANLKPIKTEKKERQPLTAEELEYVRQACVTLREKLIIEFFYSSGCRCSELTILKLKDIDISEGSVHLFGKGQKHRTSYISPRTIILLKEYLKEKNITDPEALVFPSKFGEVMTRAAMERILNNIYERCKEHLHVKLTPHILRHTLATDLLARGADITQIQKLLGHTSVNTTMIYAKISQDDVKVAHSKYIA